QGLKFFPQGRHAQDSINLLGCVLYHKKKYGEAENYFAKLLEYPESPYMSDAYFWMAKCLAKQKKDPEKVKALRKKVFEEYPQSHYAAEAFFTYYSYRDYLQGDRAALKHLLSFPEE